MVLNWNQNQFCSRFSNSFAVRCDKMMDNGKLSIYRTWVAHAGGYVKLIGKPMWWCQGCTQWPCEQQTANKLENSGYQQLQVSASGRMTSNHLFIVKFVFYPNHVFVTISTKTQTSFASIAGAAFLYFALNYLVAPSISKPLMSCVKLIDTNWFWNCFWNVNSLHGYPQCMVWHTGATHNTPPIPLACATSKDSLWCVSTSYTNSKVKGHSHAHIAQMVSCAHFVV